MDSRFCSLTACLKNAKNTKGSPLKLAPWGQTPPFIDTEWGALKKAYKMDGHQEFAWIQNGRAQSEP